MDIIRKLHRQRASGLGSRCSGAVPLFVLKQNLLKQRFHLANRQHKLARKFVANKLPQCSLDFYSDFSLSTSEHIPCIPVTQCLPLPSVQDTITSRTKVVQVVFADPPAASLSLDLPTEPPKSSRSLARTRSQSKALYTSPVNTEVVPFQTVQMEQPQVSVPCSAQPQACLSVRANPVTCSIPSGSEVSAAALQTPRSSAKFPPAKPDCRAAPLHQPVQLSGVSRDSTSVLSSFSSEVFTRVSAPQRASTRACYDAKWQVFTRWASEHDVDPMSPSMSQIADFMLFLFEDKKLQPSTIQGYRTALADRLDASANLNVGSDLFLSRLLRSFFRDRPKTLRNLPPWNLNLVLHVLSGEPFEPLRLAQFKFLTIKTVFLIALASGHRRSELHALSRERVSHTPDWSHVTLKPDPSFLAKNQDPASTVAAFAPVVIPALPEQSVLCPVRALKVYLQVSDGYRGQRKKLFIAFKQGHKSEISPITISGWLKEAIRWAYAQVSPATLNRLNIKAHQVRATASSWSAIGGSSVDQVVKACHWRSPNTFTKFYLADQTWQEGDSFALGPCVAVGMVCPGSLSASQVKPTFPS